MNYKKKSLSKRRKMLGSKRRKMLGTKRRKMLGTKRRKTYVGGDDTDDEELLPFSFVNEIEAREAAQEWFNDSGQTTSEQSRSSSGQATLEQPRSSREGEGFFSYLGFNNQTKGDSTKEK